MSLDEAYHGTTKRVSFRVGNENKTLSVKVPKGIPPGKKIKIRGSKIGVGGDIYLRVNIKDSPKFTLDGLDLTTKVKLLPWEAALGTQVIVDSFAGKIKVKIPQGIESGQKIRIPKKGYKDIKENEGDLYIEAVIVNPPHLTEEQIKLYEKLSEITIYNPRE